VVVGDVEHARRRGADVLRPVQLEARELDREHVVGLGRQHGVEQRQADVAGGDGAQPGGAQHASSIRTVSSCRWCR
jgi:hypothetical protein